MNARPARGVETVVVYRRRSGPPRSLSVPSGWREPIGAWLAWLAAANRPATTRELREYQLRRAAAGLAVADPALVTTDDLAAWLAGQRWSAETRRSYRSALMSFFGYLHDVERIRSNPARRLPPTRRTAGVPRVTPDQVLADALRFADPRERLMLTLAARLGLRRGEIARVHTADLVQSGAGWSLRVHGKGARERVVPLPDDIAELLRYRAPGWVFDNGTDRPMTPAHVGKLMSARMPPGWTAHTLRHRFATRAYAAAHDLFAVQALLGHSSPETTRRYVHVDDAALRAAVAAVGA